MKPYDFANRKQRRQAAALERKTGGVLVDPNELEQLRRMNLFFMAMVMEAGRVRISEKTFEAMKERDSIKAKHADGFVTLTYEPAEPQEGIPG